MDPGSQREQSLFEAALDFADPAQRRAFLDRECGEDHALRERIEKLLALSQSADDFFTKCGPALEEAAANADPAQIPSAAQSALVPEPGQSSHIGPYKLLQKLGEGGCGAVYMAEQERPVRRRVAVKIIKLGMDTKAVIARFEAERQALALMDHPNIARVLDAGATETGRPYFVMELVYGVKITDYCDQNRLGMRDRLELFVRVCNAVQHAHQKGIIHRDLKPSNIMVTMHDGVPVPKVIDFGIAKATAQSLTEKTLFTSYAQLIGTPAYMSPEQMELSGLNLDTRSDIYSLGVLLYELLTGRTPFDTTELLKSGVDEMKRTVRERDPLSPSAKLNTLGNDELTKTARVRQVEPHRLLSQLDGDLDWIVMKCLEKDRVRRYETAHGLATDIYRYLSQEPVLARPPSRWYRLQKLVLRNRIVFLAGAAVAAALLLGTIVSTFLFFREREARTSETRLRREAELREKASRVALLVTQRRFNEADKLLADIPVNKPSIEVAAELRALGDWHASNMRWKEAVDRFGSALKVHQLDDRDVISLDHLKLAVALLQAGDRRGYEEFREKIVANLTPSTDPALYSLIKACLLLPVAPNLLPSVLSSLEVGTNRIGTADEIHTTRGDGAQRLETMALLEYRRANFGDTIRHKFLVDNPPRLSSVSFIKAMACWHLNDYSSALVQWTEGYELIHAGAKQLVVTSGSISPVFPATTEPRQLEGFWYEWAAADLFMRECDGLIAEADQFNAQISGQATDRQNAALFRALGEWHALHGEWAPALQRFESCLLPDQKDAWDHLSMSFLDATIACLELGNESSYHRLREEATSQFKDTDNKSVAERVLKANLLRPIDEPSAARLEPFANVLARLLPSANQTQTRTNANEAEYSMVLGLFAYRRGDYAKARDWAQRSLDASSDKALPNAADFIILSMSLHQLGDRSGARLKLEQAETLIRTGFDLDFDIWHRSGAVLLTNWRDWVFVRLLLQEAKALIPQEPVPPSSATPR